MMLLPTVPSAADRPILPTLERLRLANELIGDMWTTATAALIEVVGDEKAARYIRPHYKANMRAEWLLRTEQLGMDKGSLVTLGYFMSLGGATAGLKATTEVTEHSVIFTVYECPFGHSGQEGFCRLHSLFFDSVYEELEIDCVNHVVMCRGRGDPFCQHVAAPRSAHPEKKQKQEESPIAITGPTLPPEVVLEMGERLASDLWISTVQALSDAVGGERALSILRPLMRKLGHAAGIRFGSVLGLRGDSEEDLAKTVSLLHEIMQQPTIVRQTDDGFEEAVGGCPYEDSPDEVHSLFHAFAEGVCHAVGTRCRLTIERGEGVLGTCRWSVRCPRRLRTSSR